MSKVHWKAVRLVTVCFPLRGISVAWLEEFRFSFNFMSLSCLCYSHAVSKNKQQKTPDCWCFGMFQSHVWYSLYTSHFLRVPHIYYIHQHYKSKDRILYFLVSFSHGTGMTPMDYNQNYKRQKDSIAAVKTPQQGYIEQGRKPPADSTNSTPLIGKAKHYCRGQISLVSWKTKLGPLILYCGFTRVSI